MEEVEWHPVVSSGIEALGLGKSGQLYVRFKGGGVYVYDGEHYGTLQLLLSESERASMGEPAASVGKLFKTLIKDGGFEYHRLTGLVS